MISVKSYQNLVRTSYSPKDAIILLKDLTNDMKELSTKEREKLIQSGVHYSEMLPAEKAPSQQYMDLYNEAMRVKKDEIAHGIAKISEMAMLKTGYISSGDKSKTPIIVSLARAGIPVGVLMKRYIESRYSIDCPHYAISIIRDKGIDYNAMNFIYENECKFSERGVENIIFVDGWTGKGMIMRQLQEAVSDLKARDSKWENLSDELFVLADPANITEYCGTRADYMLPSACLNSTVSGLISRSILNSYADVENGDFHGAVYFEKFEDIDNTNKFIDDIANCFNYISNVNRAKMPIEGDWNGMSMTMGICEKYGVKDFKKVKPGIGETTRVLLRRVPWKVLISSKVDLGDRDIQHIRLLCEEKNVPIEFMEMGNYKVCGIIKELSADA